MDFQPVPDTDLEHTKANQFSVKSVAEPLSEAQSHANSQALQQETGWLEGLVRQRVQAMKERNMAALCIPARQLLAAPALKEGAYTRFVEENGLNDIERLVLALAFAAQYKPQVLDYFLEKMPPHNRVAREFGGAYNRETGQFIPTLQTALFLLAGVDEAAAITCLAQLQEENVLFRDQIIHLENQPGQPAGYLANYTLRLDSAYFNYFLIGKKPRLDLDLNFPATLLETDKSFDDLILNEATRRQLQSLVNFIQSRHELFGKADVKGKIKPGFVSLLHGMPGTGKTMTVSVLGKELGIDVYAINLSRVVSKYIGETEKNLERVFNRLEHKDCLLFFDEADALFGKRTEVKEAKDRYANQEVAYLLQRIEKCTGPVILASNYKQNLDDAFKRRILSYIHLPPPEYQERWQMWTRGLPASFQYQPQSLADQMANDYSLTGANIANVIKLACIQAVSEGTSEITKDMLEPYISLEMKKENAAAMPNPGKAARAGNQALKGRMTTGLKLRQQDT